MEPEFTWAEALNMAQRLFLLSDLIYRRWRHEGQQTDWRYRASWERLKAKLLDLPAAAFGDQFERYNATCEKRTVAAANLWRPVSIELAPPDPIE